jgi:SET domain-containing protein
MNPYNLELLTYLAPSKVCDGVGVFALVNISKGTIIFKPSKNIKVSWSFISEDIYERVKSITINDDEGFWIDCDLNKIYGAYYINHTDKNENVRYNYENGSWYATRDILKDEELINTYEKEEKDWLT